MAKGLEVLHRGRPGELHVQRHGQELAEGERQAHARPSRKARRDDGRQNDGDEHDSSPRRKDENNRLHVRGAAAAAAGELIVTVRAVAAAVARVALRTRVAPQANAFEVAALARRRLLSWCEEAGRARLAEPMFFLVTFILLVLEKLFAKLANFERLLLGCINAKLCK